MCSDIDPFHGFRRYVMFDLLMAILSSASTSIFMRISEKRINGRISLLSVNYMVCTLLGALFVGGSLAPVGETGFPFALTLGGINGILYAAPISDLVALVTILALTIPFFRRMKTAPTGEDD